MDQGHHITSEMEIGLVQGKNCWLQSMARYKNLWVFLNQHQSKADNHPNNFENCGSEKFWDVEHKNCGKFNSN